MFKQPSIKMVGKVLLTILALGSAGGTAVFTMQMVFGDSLLQNLPTEFNWLLIVFAACSLFSLPFNQCIQTWIKRRQHLRHLSLA